MIKLSALDESTLNKLIGRELGKLSKAAGIAEGVNETTMTEQNKMDHETYLKTLDDILASDDKQSWDPNDPILD